MPALSFRIHAAILVATRLSSDLRLHWRRCFERLANNAHESKPSLPARFMAQFRSTLHVRKYQTALYGLVLVAFSFLLKKTEAVMTPARSTTSRMIATMSLKFFHHILSLVLTADLWNTVASPRIASVSVSSVSRFSWFWAV